MFNWTLVHEFEIGRLVAGLIVSLVTIGGCTHSNRESAHLQGAVTIDGKAIPADAECSVSFKVMKQGQGRSTSARIIDGRYDAPQAPKGKVKVYFNVQQPTGKMLREGIGSPYPEYRSLVPAPYERGMDVDISGDNPKLDFDLKTDAT